MLHPLRLRSDKPHRPAHHGVVDRGVELPFGVAAQIGEDAGDQIFEGAMAAEYRRSCQRAIGQVGFERLNKPALVLGRQVVLDSGWASPGMRLCPASVPVLLQVEDGSKGKSIPGARGEGDEFDLRIAGCSPDRAVGRAEVDTDRRDLSLAFAAFYSLFRTCAQPLRVRLRSLKPQCENGSMQRSCTTVGALLAASIVLVGSAGAQQTPATNPTPPAKAQPSTGTTTRHTSTATKPKPLVLETEKDKASYAIGLNVGKGLHRDSIDVEPKILLQGIEDALADGKLLLTDDEI
jgi:hypothetical protein